MGYQINPDVSLFGLKAELDENRDASEESEMFVAKIQDNFIQAEETGSAINYRCVTCRSCKTCKNHDQTEALSIREEVEQDIINKSVVVDITNRSTEATLPFMSDPSIKLAPNKNKALKVFNQQMKKLSKNQKDKDDVIQSENKLQSLGHVDYIKNLSEEMQIKLKNSPVQNFIPWRTVWKDNSLSTPCRLVFDASQIADSGFSLNNLLAKGKNNMNKLQEIIIRWSIHKAAFHADIKKMYNSVRLHEKDWCCQRYIWQEQLDSNKIPEEKIINTLIYGVKSSGNQAERGLRETAKLSQHECKECQELMNWKLC